MLYFDQTATTKPNQEVLDVYMQTSNKCWYNASSNYVLGTKSKQLFDKASILALNSLGVTNKKVVFTSGATEANNLAIYGICNKYLTVKEDGDLNLGGICLVAGLGPENNLRRDGTYEYYMSEPIVENDAKGVGPFIMAYTEVKRLNK